MIKYVNRLLDIEAMLDFRYAIIAKNFPDALKTLDMDAYIDRDGDYMIPDMIGITKEDWDSLYNNRDLNELAGYSRITKILPRMAGHYADEISTAMLGPRTTKQILTIAAGGIDLSDGIEDALRSAILNYIPPLVDIVISNRSIQDFTPKDIKGTYSEVIIYDMRYYFDSYFEHLKQVALPEVPFLCPLNILDDTGSITIDLPEEYVEEAGGYLEITKQLLSVVIDYSPGDLSEFCLIGPTTS